MKNNISYYRHLTNAHHHWKFKTLRRRYKWEGEGKFWALNNIIAEAENCRLDVSDEDMKASIAADLDFDVDEFEDYLGYIISKCKLIKVDDQGLLYTDMTQEIFEDVNEKRENERLRKSNNKKKVGGIPAENGKSGAESEKGGAENAKSGAENEQRIEDNTIVEQSTVDDIFIIINGEDKKLKWLQQMFDVDVGLKMQWAGQGYDKKDFLNGVEIWAARNHKKSYENLISAREHLQNWLPNYHLSKKNKKENGNNSGYNKKSDTGKQAIDSTGFGKLSSH